jgi:tRNA(fMet)-specific endonuclease VapC
MNGYLLDVIHATALWRGHRALGERVAANSANSAIHLCRPGVGELWYRVFDSGVRSAEQEKTLNEFLSRFVILDYDAAAAIHYGRIKKIFQRIGRPISEVDLQTAAIALVHEMTVVSAEQHFSVVVGLKVESWLAAGV